MIINLANIWITLTYFVHFLDHASYVENLLLKDSISLKSSSVTGSPELTQKCHYRLRNKKLVDAGDRVVYFVGTKPEYGVIKKIYSKEGLQLAEVTFVSSILYS